MTALLWADRNHRHFVGNAEGVQLTDPIYRTHWTQLDESESELPVRLELEIQQTLMSKSYYDMCGAIGQLNRQRQELGIECSLLFKTFDKRVGSSIHAIIIVNAMNFHQLLAGTGFCTLADQLIDNNYEQLSNKIFTRSRTQEQLAATMGDTPARIVPQPTKSLDKKQSLDGTVSNRVKQLDCKVCKKKTTMTCNVCSYPVAPDGSTSYKPYHVCGPNTVDNRPC
jgi:hypothetical protein